MKKYIAILILLFSCTKQTVDNHVSEKVQLQTPKPTSSVMEHPAPNGTEIMLSVTELLQLSAIVISSEFNTIDGAYHYNLQSQFTDGNNANTVQVNDVHQSLVIIK